MDYLASSAEAISRVDVGEIENAIRIIQDVKEKDGTVWVVGNGGSAATAEHFANDLVKVGGVRAIAIPSIAASVSAFGNDNGWERMYADLLMALRWREDVLVAISCSGESANVVHAAGLFDHRHLIILTGERANSKLAMMDADSKIFVKSPDIRIQEDAHLAVCHAIAGGLE